MKNDTPERYHAIVHPVQARESSIGTIPLHWHTYYEIEYISRGTVRQMINGEPILCRPGTVSVLTPTDFHSYTPTEQIFYVKKFILRADCITPSLALLLQKMPRYLFGMEALEKDFDTVIAKCRVADTPLGMLSAQNYAESVCISLLSAASLSADTKNPHEDPTMRTVLDYIGSHFTEPITLAKAASLIHLDENYFSRWFHRKLGLTFSHYIKLLRIQYAAELLSGDRSMEEIACTVGFASVSFFCNAFREQYQMSPTQFRKFVSQLP